MALNEGQLTAEAIRLAQLAKQDVGGATTAQLGLLGSHPADNAAIPVAADSEAVDANRPASPAVSAPNCAMCGQPDKYRCPKCERKTCSLACVKAHKAQYECDGIRPRSRMTREKSELTDQVLWRDYCFLEDAARMVGAKTRPIGASVRQAAAEAPTAGTGDVYRNFGRLLKVASSHGIRLELLPDVYERHRANTSRAHDRMARIHWRVEVVFGSVKFTQPRVPCARPLRQILDAYLLQTSENAVERHKVEPYWRRRAEATVLVANLDTPATARQYVRLDEDMTLRDALRFLRVLEFPTLHVVLPEDMEAHVLCERPTSIPPPLNTRPPGFRGRARGRGRGRGQGRGRGGRGRGPSSHASRGRAARGRSSSE
ncbi:uncharacterized protein MONBRDRAFT_37229 [Monosiga brevicollis MX1]|uniref:Box C/D snoRNA protein 1 n=1 Tax=Monosiga brevicollis TaxID=81824 RepID=A9V0F0_MONBE|nr:uncharacterized protein MONBRDRAFT_37229 [Monosiga brevicollis MX1]EDQ88998.1 predicted protein [Monosiga brevicollis MX1]|eukprot:XP_001746103.1 hypothetical protein [Monosiga brevicollis MX1]